ncbi:MAG TPA: hypothetical protein VHU40_07495 [Polyangia bacterium]|jgi:chaperonin GroEL (HSP60 family)|nr:hypothetical protein [Polyangia bacterium]
MAHKRLLFQLEARETILRRASQLTDAVRVTLGSRSKCVLFDKRWGAVSVAGTLSLTEATMTELPEDKPVSALGAGAPALD